MGRITFTADDTHERIIEEVEQEDGIESKSEAVRECITRAEELQHRDGQMQKRVEELQQDLEDAERRAERLERANLLILERERQTDALVEYVEAGFWGRLKQSLFDR